MTPKTIANYGGPYKDATVRENPETDLDAANGNRVLEDAAQMTQTSPRAEVQFATTSTAAPTSVTPTHQSHWGSGPGQAPTVSKTATGRYTVTYAASFVDALNVTENVAFLAALVQAWSSNVSDDVHAQLLSVSSNQVTLKVESPRGTLADLGNVSGSPINVDLCLR